MIDMALIMFMAWQSDKLLYSYVDTELNGPTTNKSITRGLQGSAVDKTQATWLST
jgi:hypothetical protein